MADPRIQGRQAKIVELPSDSASSDEDVPDYSAFVIPESILKGKKEEKEKVVAKVATEDDVPDYSQFVIPESILAKSKPSKPGKKSTEQPAGSVSTSETSAPQPPAVVVQPSPPPSTAPNVSRTRRSDAMDVQDYLQLLRRLQDEAEGVERAGQVRFGCCLFAAACSLCCL